MRKTGRRELSGDQCTIGRKERYNLPIGETVTLSPLFRKTLKGKTKPKLYNVTKLMLYNVTKLYDKAKQKIRFD